MDDQELDGLYARLRDAEDARQAAVGVIQRQNETLARVRALHASKSVADGRWASVCAECDTIAPCPTLKALNA